MTAHGLYISQVQFITVVSKGTFLELRVHFQTGRTHLSVLEAWCTNGQLDSMVHVAYQTAGFNISLDTQFLLRVKHTVSYHITGHFDARQ